MNSGLAETLGISPDIFHWVLLPVLIFIARIGDVSINTLRVIFMLNGRKGLSTVMGFFESLIWLIAISQILQNIDSWVSYVAYAGGFATGIWVGMMIENRLAIGNVVVRIIAPLPTEMLQRGLEEEGYRLTVVKAEGTNGPVSIIFLVIRRINMPVLADSIRRLQPNAFYTIEGVKHVTDLAARVSLPEQSRYSIKRLWVRK